MTVSNFNKIAEAGYQYDPAGNMTNEPGETYQFDAENRISSVNGGSVGAYVYDAGGRRVRKTVAAGVTDYFYDLGGNVVAERQAGVWTKAYVYAGGQLVAQYSNATTYFVHKDHLGSTRMLTTVSQAVSATFDYQPFGESIGSGSATTHKFTGKERDDESGLDDFGARYYSSAYGRFMSADPPFIDQHPGDPQSWNLFAYVRNNPLKFVDPTGHSPAICQNIASCQPMENSGTGTASGNSIDSDEPVIGEDLEEAAERGLQAVSELLQSDHFVDRLPRCICQHPGVLGPQFPGQKLGGRLGKAIGPNDLWTLTGGSDSHSYSAAIVHFSKKGEFLGGEKIDFFGGFVAGGSGEVSWSIYFSKLGYQDAVKIFGAEQLLKVGIIIDRGNNCPVECSAINRATADPNTYWRLADAAVLAIEGGPIGAGVAIAHTLWDLFH